MNEFILFITGGLGALITFIVAHDLRQGVVRSSAGLSLLVGMIFYGLGQSIGPLLAIEIPLVFIGSSFVGMMGSHLVKNKLLILLGGLIFSGIYLASANVFIGYGGKLGTAACMSSCVILGFSYLIRRFFNRERTKTAS